MTTLDKKPRTLEFAVETRRRIDHHVLDRVLGGADDGDGDDIAVASSVTEDTCAVVRTA